LAIFYNLSDPFEGDPLMPRPDFDLSKIFEALNSDDVKDVASRLARTALAGGKAALDQALHEFPEAAINSAASDLYKLIAGPRVTELLESGAKQREENTVKAVEAILTRLQNPDTVARVLTTVQPVLAKLPMKTIDSAVIKLLEKAPAQEQQTYAIIYTNVIRPALDQARTSDPKTLAAKIAFFASFIPAEEIAAQITDFTNKGSKTPDVAAKQKELLAKLPEPETLSGIVHGVGKAASKRLGEAVEKPAKTIEILTHLPGEAIEVVADKLAGDAAAKAKKAAPKKRRKKDGPEL
jgi:hypothetical protein